MNTQSTHYAGIDYGNSATNRDKANGIRYGVLPQNEVLQAWADSSKPEYGPAHCPKCGHEVKSSGDSEADYADKDFTCEHCEKSFWSDDCFGDEPNGFTYDRDGYEASSGQGGDIFVIKSPYFTYAQLCSPCAPGACYLLHPLTEPNDNNKAYCFGHDWFEDGQAPYPVYSVETGELVNP